MKTSLCHTCAFMREVSNKRGSIFFQCEKSRSNPSYARYPMQPVWTCKGYEPRPQRKEGENIS
ncbi:MAG: hypothetical protein R3C61_11600 [Bacteroidia bacterium]